MFQILSVSGGDILLSISRDPQGSFHLLVDRPLIQYDDTKFLTSEKTYIQVSKEFILFSMIGK